MKIILFDDHQLFSNSLSLALTKDFDSFTTYTQHEDFLRIIEKDNPDIVLLDIHLGEKNGIEEGRKILKTFPDTKLIFLSGYALREYHEQAIQMGAKAFINKNSTIIDLVAKIKLVYSGNTIFPDYQKISGTLTNREKEILQLIATGYSQQEIADILSSSRRTISTHVQHILEKLNVHSTVSAIVRGIELGIVRIQL